MLIYDSKQYRTPSTCYVFSPVLAILSLLISTALRSEAVPTTEVLPLGCQSCSSCIRWLSKTKTCLTTCSSNWGFQMAVMPSELLFKASSNELWIERLNMFTFSNWKNQVTANSLPVWHRRPCPRHRARCAPAARRWPRVCRACLPHSCGHGHRHGPPHAALGREIHGSLWRSSLHSVINS